MKNDRLIDSNANKCENKKNEFHEKILFHLAENLIAKYLFVMIQSIDVDFLGQFLILIEIVLVVQPFVSVDYFHFRIVQFLVSTKYKM